MTEQPSTTLATPPTRLPASEPAGSANPPDAKAATPMSSTAVPDSTASPDSTPSETPPEPPALAVEPSLATELPVSLADPSESLAAQASEATPETTSPAAAPDQPVDQSVESNEAAAPPVSRNQPIPPASEPMQYRAIGLVRGKYTPSEEQFTRGGIITDDGVTIDAVLLGRVMSLVKKHIDLAESHLWVVYPRTREKNLELHMQIVGVWEPDKLNRMGGEASATEDLDESEPDDELAEAVDAADAEVSEPETAAETVQPEPAEEPTAEPEAIAAAEPAASEPGASEPEATDTPVAADTIAEPAVAEDSETKSDADLDDCYFSVRGEVVFQAEEEERLLVKIRRAPKPGETEGKAFKVALKGSLTGKALGYFWDMQVRREGSDLIVQEATQIGMVPPQKRKPGHRGGGRPPRRGAGGPPRRAGQAGQAGPPRKRWDSREGGRESGREGGRENRPYRSERPSAPMPATPKPPVAKPVKRQKEEPSS